MASTPQEEERHRNLGVLYMGYLEKRNPITGRYKRRFVVLTHEAIHWFQRNEGYDLFGEERGNVSLGSILSTRILENDSNIFEIQGTDTKKRLFRGMAPLICEEWVSAIRSAVKVFTDKQRARGTKKLIARRQSLSNIKFCFEEDLKENPADTDNEISVQLVSVYSSQKKVEFIVARRPVFNHIISIPAVFPEDKLMLSLSNGGSVTLTYADLEYRSDGLIEFEMSVQNVALASSLNLLFEREQSPKAAVAGATGRGQTSNQWVDQVSSALDDRTQAVSVILAMAVIVLLFSSFKSVDGDTFLLYLFAFVLSIYQLVQVARNGKGAKAIVLNPSGCEQSLKDGKSVAGGLTVRLTILGHSFTSSDAPINEDSDEIPERFVNGCEGDMKEARRRWDITRHWRESEGVDKILYEKQPHFNIIKSMYPHYHAGVGKEGHVVFYEREGHIEVDQLAARGIKCSEMLKHWIFVTEYHWEVVCGGDPMAKSISVMDLDRLQLRDLAGTNMDYVKAAMGYANQHYPERSSVVFIVNAPWYFSVGWKMVKGLVHPNTQKKIKILNASETLAGLQEHIDISQIPVYYGGQLDYSKGSDKDSCRFSDPANLALQEYVDKLNRGEVVAPASDKNTGHKSPAVHAATLAASSSLSLPSTSSVGLTTTSSGSKVAGSEASDNEYDSVSPSDEMTSIASSGYSINSSNTSSMPGGSTLNAKRMLTKGVTNRSVTFADGPTVPPESPAPSERSVSSLGMTN